MSAIVQQPTKTFGLQGPRDLLRKLEMDVATLTALSTADADLVAFAAFNCAIDAWSLRDWCWHWLAAKKRTDLGGDAKQLGRTLFAAIPNLEICVMLCNGAKHFQIDKDDRAILSRVSTAPTYATAGDMLCGDPLVSYDCVAKIWTPAGGYRATEFFEGLLHNWRDFLDAHAIDVRC